MAPNDKNAQNVFKNFFRKSSNSNYITLSWGVEVPDVSFASRPAMGNRCAPECVETDACPLCKQDKEDSFSVLHTHDKADVVRLDLKRSPLVQQMTGIWYDKQTGQHMGEIFDDHLYWNFSFGLPPALIETQLVNTVQLDVQGKVLHAQVSLEAQATITWRDGSVWLRK